LYAAERFHCGRGVSVFAYELLYTYYLLVNYTKKLYNILYSTNVGSLQTTVLLCIETFLHTVVVVNNKYSSKIVMHSANQHTNRHVARRG
jgi:hypothetical protein